MWEFLFPRGSAQVEPHELDGLDSVRLDVPCVWEALAPRVKYRGQALARRLFSTDAAGPIRLVFKGVSHTARVFLDGREVGAHHDAFTPFSIELPDVVSGAHELVVHITNEHGELSGLHVPNDYYDYGGITRPVEVQFPCRRVFLRRVDATPRYDRLCGAWRLACRVLISNLAEPMPVDVTVAVAGARTVVRVEAEHGETEVLLELLPRGVVSWCPATPELYQLEATLSCDGAAIDDWSDRIGFRSVSCDGERLLLNDDPVLLLGFNRHEDHPTFGCAIPVAAMRHDLALILGTHANAVRTSHYPNDERFLDLCDELGLLVWEENHARGQDVTAMKHPRFREQCATVTREMVREHFNHPSIVTWGVMNECASESEIGREMYAEQFALIRELDPSRPTTYASCRHSNDRCQDLPDICSWNVYPRWYLERDPVAFLDEIVARFGPLGMAGKPLIVSETGAGALPGYRDPIRRAKWSEERQAEILTELVRAYAGHPRVCGLFVWQFCDVRVDESWAPARPRCMNNKGVVDEYRRPKLGYDAVKAAFADASSRLAPALRPRTS